jgi:Flp pilus assembly pilin Flp
LLREERALPPETRRAVESSERRIAMKRIRKFVLDESGLETVEYAIITGMIAAATIVTIALINLQVNARFESLLSALGLM